ncbi:Thioredoxin family protein [Sulfidibacter corallicola]|uniref:Thioredoxin family protein n=1 Tax=Sulfidibacter corallicola TaxID=2818388 RepID=A0A8A4TMI7_SULCO|nr:thioredoxin family protein [Sulfidibacter corallicola]QTD51186.1 thioredoxin family protein [Sulfidibacter corallicola]
MKKWLLLFGLISGFGVGVFGYEDSLILKGGEKVKVTGSVGLDRNMLVFRTEAGVNMMLSKALVNWPATAKVAPHVFKAVFPGQPLPKPPRVVKQAQPKRKIVIDKDALSKLKPGQGLTNKWDGDIPKLPPKTSQPKTAAAPSTAGDAPRIPVIQTISRSNRVDLNSHMDRQRYVMFDFYADWCGPCRKITPKLEALVRKYPHKVALKKIDIKTWGSPVAEQYRINSIPHVKLYDPSGKQMVNGSAQGAIRKIESLASREGW